MSTNNMEREANEVAALVAWAEENRVAQARIVRNGEVVWRGVLEVSRVTESSELPACTRVFVVDSQKRVRRSRHRLVLSLNGLELRRDSHRYVPAVQVLGLS